MKNLECPACNNARWIKSVIEGETIKHTCMCGNEIVAPLDSPVPALKSTGEIREFPSGAIRDSAIGKPPMELLPWDLLERLAFHYGLGGEKYGENNWRRGQPDSAVLGSVLRHISKYTRNETDEDHLAAAIWGLFTLMNNETYHQDNPLIRDILDWYENGKPTGKGSYRQKGKI